jgi:hypothetical protein
MSTQKPSSIIGRPNIHNGEKTVPISIRVTIKTKNKIRMLLSKSTRGIKLGEVIEEYLNKIDQ